MANAADYLEKEIDQAIAHADRRRRKHKRISTSIWLMSSGSTAAIPILLGLRVPPEVGNQLANLAMVLGGVASVLITYEADIERCGQATLPRQCSSVCSSRISAI
jgi:hypothetical protein